MATEQTLIRELIRAKHINAKREVEALQAAHPTADFVCTHLAEWRGQEIAFKQLLDILS